jgi:hypothetical protein
MTVDRLLVLTVAALLAAAGGIWLAQVDDDAEAHAEDTRHQWFPDSPRSHSRQITKDPHAHPARR